MPWTSTFPGACVVRPLCRGSGPPSCPVLGGTGGPESLAVQQARCWLCSRMCRGRWKGCWGARDGSADSLAETRAPGRGGCVRIRSVCGFAVPCPQTHLVENSSKYPKHEGGSDHFFFFFKESTRFQLLDKATQPCVLRRDGEGLGCQSGLCIPCPFGIFPD